MKTENIFFIILIISLIFLILDYLIFKTHQNIENFENSNIIIKKINNNTSNKKTTPSSSNEEKSEDISFMTDINNENLTIKDFYPTKPDETNKEELLKFAYDTDLFHQIIPKFGGGYLGIIWFDNRINGIYNSSSLKSKEWEYIKNSIPENMLRPIFISYDKDKKLLGIFEDKNKKYHLYKKIDIDINSEWEFIEKTKVISFIYDTDEKLIGLDEDGVLYKKENYLLESKWQKMDNINNIPMRKLIFDYRDGYMIGLSQDFQVYKKKGLDWKSDDWNTFTLPKSLSGTVRDIWFDFDGILLGLSRIGLVKKENGNYLSKFKEYEEEVKEKTISIYDIMYTLTGIKTFASTEDLGNNINNIYVDGKKISEYQFKDPKLNKYLKHRMDLKKQCRRMKGLKLRDLEATSQEESNVRNQKFIDILGNQNDMIEQLYETITDLKDRHY